MQFVPVLQHWKVNSKRDFSILDGPSNFDRDRTVNVILRTFRTVFLAFLGALGSFLFENTQKLSIQKAVTLWNEQWKTFAVRFHVFEIEGKTLYRIYRISCGIWALPASRQITGTSTWPQQILYHTRQS